MKNIKLRQTNIAEAQVNSNTDIIGSAVENEIMGGDVKEFNHLFTRAYNETVNAFDAGGWTEYYNEDGIVVMTTQTEQDNSIIFDFGTGSEFKFKREGF